MPSSSPTPSPTPQMAGVRRVDRHPFDLGRHAIDMADDTADDSRPLQAVPDRGAARLPGNMLQWSAAKAARETGAARSTILDALKSGRIDATKDENGAWQITPQALAAAGFAPGKPSPPDPVPVEQGDDLNRLRLELAEVRADVRVAVVERDAERQLRESAERERDIYRRMLEAPPVTTPSFPQADAQPAVDPTPTLAHDDRPTPKAGKWRKAWNVARYG